MPCNKYGEENKNGIKKELHDILGTPVYDEPVIID
jgi:hypothetical protein